MGYTEVCALCLPEKRFVEDGRHVGVGYEHDGSQAADAERRNAGHPAQPIELHGDDVQRTMLDAVLAHVRRRVPGAVYLDLATTDQSSGYGFVLGEVTAEDGTNLRPDSRDFEHPLGYKLDDEVTDWLADLDWNGVVGEGYGGYATIDLRTGRTIDAS